MKFVLFNFLFIYPMLLPAQDIAGILKEADQYETSMNDAQAIVTYRKVLAIQPYNIFALCKCSELCTRIAGRLKDNEVKQDDYYNVAKVYAQSALRVDPLYSDANFVMALTMGKEAIRKGGSEKIKAVKDVKKYADLSIKYDSRNYKAWFVLGKWYYEVSGLNYFERTAVKIFFGALPPATIDDAINCLEKVKILDPSFILNYLSLAKAYKRNDEENVARQNIMAMFNLPDKTQDDETIKNEGRELLKKWE